ncbi:[protein-PII] uridylyltransferase [Mariprofundus sp. EBB-1]|uniref:[protein-PII] uridylyltransferase n=1 Tax=Mariprofundus sp. EBB-1 TaxID=2650971 RepID=UPI000EF1A96C|nr:[protein-PII] uridylyltransferase [Mariprofundus sp. EBB-1]RLL51752.1 [protein-PII] uridylyltransferase [Mariprofundus sp. EBB-1]
MAANAPVALPEKEQIQALYEAVGDAFDAGANGAALSQQMCAGVDALLIELWQKQAPMASACVDLVAVGGYGRGELAPHSDWDLWFLVPESLSSEVEEEMQSFLRALWDMGAHIGYAVRNIKETMQHLNEDWASATAALESRLLMGSGYYYNALNDNLKTFFKKNRKAFIDAKLIELEARYDRTGRSAFMMEPDIKEARGGLRDVQTVFWLAKAWYGRDNVHDLVQHGAISELERDQLLEAQEFLWRCRAALHLEVKRASDRLGFEQQIILAERMHYESVIKHLPGVDAFMKEYFRHVGRISRITGMMRLHFQELLNPQYFTFKRDIGDGFTLEGNRVGIRDADVFKEDPLRLLRVFLISQEDRRLLSSQVLRQIRADVGLIDNKFRDNPEAHALFLQILRHKRNVHWTLRGMNITGVLGRFIPEFRDVVGLGQFNRYHACTVDEHTLRALGEARNFWHRNRDARLPLAHDICLKIKRPELLYIALIFHDIAKGMEGDHSQNGAIIARRFCQRIGLNRDATDLVSWLVEEHLLMAVKSQRFDLSDPDVINAFAQRVGDSERLDYLLLLSVADIAAVGPNVWNDWKGSLLQELYHATSDCLLGEDAGGEAAKERYRTRIETVLEQDKNDTHRSRLQAAMALIPKSCVMHFPPGQLTEIASLLIKNSGSAIHLWVDKKRAETLAIVVAKPRTGLFATLAATLTSGPANIISAQAYKLADERILDVFHLQGNEGAPFNIDSDLQRLQSRVSKVLDQDQLDKLDIHKKFKVNVLMKRVPVRVRELPKASYRETAIEVSAADQPRLLARLADAISREGYSLHGASVSTFGERAVDVFFLESKQSEPLSTDDITALCEKLARVATLPKK